LGAGNNGPVSTAAASSFLDAAPLVTLISGGQPVIFVRNGRPVAVVIDVDSYEEAEVVLAAGA
jgi:PHD/YefM family antitoxin component YafN of YafNO toxin-antitoxin module